MLVMTLPTSNFINGDLNNQFEKKKDSNNKLKYRVTDLVSWDKYEDYFCN